MSRRSDARAAPRKKYTVDAFEGIEELQDARSDDEDAKLIQDEDDSAEDGDTAEYRGDDMESQEDDEDEMSGIEGDLRDETSDEASDAGERHLDDRASIAGDENHEDEEQHGLPISLARPTKTVVFSRYGANHGVPSTERVYVRSLPDLIQRGSSKETRRTYQWGPSCEDHRPPAEARNKWFDAPSLPCTTRGGDGSEGKHRSFYLNDGDWANMKETARIWWLERGGKRLFNERQLFEPLDANEASHYIPERTASTCKFLMGTHKRPRFFELRPGGHVALDEAWKQQPGKPQGVPKKVPERKGFVIHLGGKVQCLEWAPNKDDAHQYLATSILWGESLTSDESGNLKSTAFAPPKPHKTCIRIWRFERREDGSLNNEIEPKLALVLCTDWGDAKSLKWCPILSEDSPQTDEESLGLLAGLWSDGVVRILNVSLPSVDGDTHNLHVKDVAFESRAPGTLFTCITWADGQRLAAGTAIGSIAVWDIRAAMTSKSGNARPGIYSSAATTYIANIVSGFPSRPNTLFAVSMTGVVAMTDLTRTSLSLSSAAATVHSQRTRIAQMPIAWHDFSQAMFQVDDTFTLRASMIRRVFATLGVGRFRSNAVCLATSPVHPFVLVGTANGDTVTTNPMNRIMEGKAGIWQQTWFAHEWRRPTAEEVFSKAGSERPTQPEAQTESTASGSDPSPAQPKISSTNGLARITEGFRMDRVTLMNDERNMFNQVDGVVFSTVFEDKSAVTAVAWNPNIRAGGWAAAGMGTGLVRVEDVSVEGASKENGSV